MFEKLFSFPKRYWVMLHVLELVLGFSVLIGQYPHMSVEVLPWSQMVINYVSMFVFVGAIGMAVFPVAISLIHSVGEIYEYLPEYVSILLVVVLFVMYYTLWLVPDKKWNETQLYWVRRVRIVWFLISSIAVWVAVFQPL